MSGFLRYTFCTAWLTCAETSQGVCCGDLFWAPCAGGTPALNEHADQHQRFIFEFAEPTLTKTRTAAELEEQFRAFLLRLASYQGPHKQLPLGRPHRSADVNLTRFLDSVFHIEVQKVLPNDQLQKWIPTDRVSTGTATNSLVNLTRL